MTNRLRQSVKSVVQLTSANVLVKVIGLFAMAFYTRYLDKPELAVFPVYEMMAALTSVFLGFGIHPTLLRLLPAALEKDREAARGLMFTGAALIASGALVFTAGVWIFADRVAPLVFKNDAFTIHFRLMAPGFFLASLRQIAHYMLWSSSRFDRMSVVRSCNAISRVVFCVSLVLTRGLEGLVLGLVASEFVTVALSVYFLRDLLFKPLGAWYPARRLLRESVPFYFESFLIYFRSQGDNWIVATTLGPAAMATYFVAKRLPLLLLMVSESVDKIATSELSRRREAPGELREYGHRMFDVLANTTVPLILFLVGIVPVFIEVVAGANYRDAVLPGIVLCLAQLVQVLQIPLSRTIFVTRPPTTRVLLTTVESVVLIGALFVLTPLLEAVGVAASRLTSVAAAFAACVLVLRRYIDLGLPWSQLVRTGFASLVMAGLMLFLSHRSASVFLAPVHALAAVVAFLLVVSVVNSRSFYAALDTVAPFTVVDPVRWLAGRLFRSDARTRG